MQELQSSIPIETCILSQEYDQIDPIFGENQGEDSKNSSTGTSLMNAMDLTYQGEGMVIAILDTGIDVNHEAFSHAPSQVRFKREDIQNILSTCQLKAEDSIGKELSVSDVYINDKIPYAFDYCDNDTNVAPTEEALSIGNAHGTHVAGIVAAENNVFGAIVLLYRYHNSGGNFFGDVFRRDSLLLLHKSKGVEKFVFVCAGHFF